MRPPGLCEPTPQALRRYRRSNLHRWSRSGVIAPANSSKCDLTWPSRFFLRGVVKGSQGIFPQPLSGRPPSRHNFLMSLDSHCRVAYAYGGSMRIVSVVLPAAIAAKNPSAAKVWHTENRSVFCATRIPAVFSFIPFAMILTLSACAGPRIAGNEIGGVVPLVGTTQEHAVDAARTHCSIYGRSARILAIRAEEGGKAVFECV